MYLYNKKELSNFERANTLEWYLPNGLGGYSSSTAINSNYRKHNGYLVASLNPPVNRVMILNKVCEEVIVDNEVFDLEATEYENLTKEGNNYLESFEYNYIPTFNYFVNDVTIKKQVCPIYNKNSVSVTYIINSKKDCVINLIPFFNYKEHGDATKLENLKFSKEEKENVVILKTKDNHKIYFKFDNGEIIKNDDRFTEGMRCEYDFYTGDDRYDHCYKPFKLKVKVNKDEEIKVSLVIGLNNIKNEGFKYIEDYKKRHNTLIKKAKLNDDFANNLVIASDLFICDRKSTGLKTILAGLPWFTDWGRDTMIAFTGLTLVTKRFKEAKEILLSFAKYEKNGLIPNMFPDDNNKPLYNTVDASLWYFIACYKYIEYTKDYEFIIKNIYPTLKKIYEAYSTSTDFSIYSDTDGLIHAGSDLDQITWMDVRINDYVVTPRHGKPVEINALWYNALNILAMLARYNNEDDSIYLSKAELVKKSFNAKFVNKENGLFDVVDENDPSIRPNQIYAVSLPFKILPLEISKKVVDIVNKELYNIYGLRSLSKKDKKYIGVYEGSLYNRDIAYHNGTTWSFLIGPFLDAYAYVNNFDEKSIKEVNSICKGFIYNMSSYCINGISEICDGNVPFMSKGCASQAWSVAEVLRAYYEIVLRKQF